MIFYSPTAPVSEEVLRFAQSVNDGQRQRIHVLGLPIADDSPALRKQCADLGLTFPILAGKGVCLLYSVEATPKLVVLDAEGVVRGMYVGWGRETPHVVAEDLHRICH
jgi:hypothetical protein